MKNETNIKIGKKYENMVDHIYKDSNGYWCELSAGYIFSNMDCGSICEQKQTDLLNAIRNNIVAVEEETPAVVEDATVEENKPAEAVVEVPALISEIMFNADLSTNLKVTYVSMLTVVNTGAEYTKMQWAELLNTSDRQFIRNIRGLEDAGLVNVIQLVADNGRQLSNRYEILTPAGDRVGTV